MQQYYIETERLFLTTSTFSMINDILDFHKRNKAHFAQWEDIKSCDYYTKEYHRYIIKDEAYNRKVGTSLDFWIYHSLNGKLIGKISVFGIIGGNASFCTLGYKLDKDYQGFGYMHEALKSIVEMLFCDFKMHRIEIYVLPKNERSLNVCERLGFKREGLAEKYMRINGIWEDHIRFVKIREIN